VIESQSFWNDEKTQIFTSHHVQLYKIFKGEVVGEMVKIITKGGIVDDRFSIVQHETKFVVGMEGVFFCRKVKQPTAIEKVSTTTCHLTSSELGFIQYYSEHFNPPAADKSAKYKDIKSDVYANIILSARQEIREIMPNSFEKKLGMIEFPAQELNPSVAIYFTFENVTFTSNYQKIAFDVYAHASQNGIKFGKAKILINYSSEVFGAMAVSSGNVKVTKGEILNMNDYILSTTDQGSEELLIDVTSPSLAQSDAHLLTTVPEQFCHIELKIQDFGALANISFDDFQMNGNCWYIDERTGQYQLFDRVSVEGPIKGGADPNEFVTIDYSFDNIDVTQSGSDKFLEFDVNAFSNVDWTRLAVAHPIIGYNPDGFGTNPVANGRFTHVLSSDLTALGYTSSQDDLSGHINLNVSQSSPDSQKYVILTSSPMKLARCKFKILNCDANANLNFGISWMQLFPSYYFGGSPIPFIEYYLSEDGLLSFYDQSLCPENAPIITQIYPKNLRAGVFEILTVKGRNLKKSITDNGKFYFRSAINPIDSIYSYAYDSDVIQWTDSLIQIYVPSFLEEDGQSASSGKIIIENAIGKRAKSDEPITIQYSVTNVRDGDEAFRISLVNADGDGGYTFKMDDELQSLNPDDCIKKALNEWACKTRINWKLDPFGVFGLENVNNDGYSTIILGDSLVVNSSTALAFASLSGRKECDSGMSISGWHVDDVDIVINKYITFQFVCDSFSGNPDEDFYAVLVHELGHTHMLEHSVHESNAIYTYSNGVRMPSGDDIAGGIDVVNWSENWTEGGDCPKKHEPEVCSSPIFETEQVDIAIIDINPNPFQSVFTVQILGPKSDAATLYITDITGRTIITTSMQGDELKKEINMQSYPNGIYFMNIYWADKSVSSKLIKLK
jgi:Secretion system C-terminal sorting domain